MCVTTWYAALATATNLAHQVIYATSNPVIRPCASRAYKQSPPVSSYREETSAMHPAITRIPAPAATQLNGLHPPRFRARSAGNLKMLTPTIEFTISAVTLQRPIVRTSPCGLSVKLIFPEATIFRAPPPARLSSLQFPSAHPAAPQSRPDADISRLRDSQCDMF